MRRRDAVEWVVLAASVVAVAAVTLVLVLEAIGETSPADPTVVLHEGDARQATLGWVIPVTVSNGGDVSVEGVLLEATAMVGGKEEISQVDLPFLAARTDVQAEIAFSARPSGPVTVRLLGHRLP